MNLMEKIKSKSVGAYVMLAATALCLIATIMYLAFGIASQTFAGGIFVCLLLSFLLGVVLFFYDGYFGDFIPLVIVALVSVGLMLLIADSINDITALFAGMGDYFGNADNVGIRLVIAVFMLVGILTAVVGAFLRRVKK